MRANLKNFLARLAITALVILGLNVRIHAHDLPADRSLTDTVTANCFHSAPAAASRKLDSLASEAVTATAASCAPTTAGWSRQAMLQCVVRQSSPAIAAVASQPKLWKQLSQPVASLPAVWSRVVNLLATVETQPIPRHSIASPDVGHAPRPRVQTLHAAQQKNLQPAQPAWAGEVYMPYDFHLNDWRFGQFPYHAKTATAPRPKSPLSLARDDAAVPSSVPVPTAPIPPADRNNPPTRQLLALGEFLQQVEMWQCSASATLSNGPALSRSANQFAGAIEQLLLNSHRELMAAGAPLATPAPKTLPDAEHQSDSQWGPQFVIYDTTVGGHLVLTLAQARDWEFDRPRVKSRIGELLGAALKPMQNNAIAAASSQLERAGRTLLKLSESLSNISEIRVASLPQADQN